MIEHITMESLSSGERIEIGMDGYQEYWLERVDWGQATGSHDAFLYLIKWESLLCPQACHLDLYL